MAQGSTRGVPIDIDATLALNSDLVVPSQKAIKTYVDNITALKQNLLGYTPVNKAGDTMLGNLILNADPTFALQAATKKYVDENIVAGIQLHEPVRAESIANLNATYANGGTTPTITTIAGNTTLTSTAHGLSVNDVIVFNTTSNGLTAGTPYFVFSVPSVDTFTLSLSFGGIQITTLTNGTGLTLTSRANAGVGATLTNAGTQTALIVDDITMAVNDRVLVRLQTNAAQNGVYVVTSIGSGSTNWVLTRASDANKYAPKNTNRLGEGDYFYTTSGTLNAGDSHILNTSGTIVIGTTPISFAQFSGAVTYTGGTNINVTGQVISLTGQVAVANGGTGASTLTGILVGNGTSAVTGVTGAASQLLRRNAANTAYEFFSPSYITLASLSASSPLNYNNTTGAFTITQSSASQDGYLSSTDWTTFNNKQNALTNPVTGTGTTNYLPKFTGSTTIGNSSIQDGTSSVTYTYSTNPIFNVTDGTNTTRLGVATTAGAYVDIAKANDGFIRVKNGLAIGTSDGFYGTYFDVNGNLGLGTNNPVVKLELIGNYRQKALVGNSNGFNISINSSTDVVSLINYYNAGLVFGVNNAEGMRLTSTGLGIGTTSPLSALDVRAASAVNGNYQTIQAFSTDSAAINLGGGISLGGYYSGISSIAQFASIWGRKENSTSGNYDGYLAFGTNSQATGVRELMRLNSSGNLGLGVTASAWSSFTALQLGGNTYSAIGSSNGYMLVSANAYFDGTGFKYVSSAAASRYLQNAGQHQWEVATSGTAGNAISFTQAMTLNASGRLLLGTTSDSGDVFQVADGSVKIVTTPYSPTGVGFFGTSSNHPLSLITNGSTRLTITSGGNVGIGTSSPSALLHLYSSSANTIHRVEQSGALGAYSTYLNASTQLYIGVNNTSGSLYAGVGGANGGAILMDNAYALGFGTNGTERMRITSGGDLALGLTGPQQKLHVHNSGTSYVHISNDTTGTGGSDGADIGFFSGQSSLQINNRENADMVFSTNNTERFRIASTGAATFSSSVTAGGNLQTNGVLTIGNQFVSGNYCLQITPSTTTPIQLQGILAGTGIASIALQPSGGSLLVGCTTAPTAIGVSDLLVIGKSGSASNAINFSNGSTTNWGYLLAESGKMVLGSGASSNITFETNAGSERMRITSGGNVGIGTTSPGAKLEILGTSSDQLRLSTAATEHYRIGRNASSGFLDFYGSQTGYSGYTFGGVDGERMRIIANGNVGIGTSSPSEALHIYSGSTTPRPALFLETGSASGTPEVRLFQTSGRSLLMNLQTNGDWSFQNSTNNSSYNERLRITSGGNLLFAGTTAGTGNSIALRGDNGGASGYAYLQVSGNGSITEGMYLYNSSGLVGSIGTNSSALTFSTGTTERLRISSTGAATFSSTIKTAAPTGYSAQPWKLGDATSGTITPNYYIKVEINGQIYSIPALQGTP